MHEGKRCKIRKFGDPHLFFVLYDEHEEALGRLESVLEKDFIDKSEPVPKKDQIYVVKHGGKLKRTVALTKSHSFYCCWLVDYGELSWENEFYTLPPACDMKPLSIKAGLNKAAGLESYVSETGVIEFKTSDKFSPGALHTIRNEIQRAEEIYFKEELMIRNVHFGQVYLRTGASRWINLLEKMQENNIITVDEDLFNKVLMRTMEIDPKKKKYGMEEGVGIGRGYNRSNRIILPKATASNEEQIQDWLTSTMHEIFILTDSCSPQARKVDEDSLNHNSEEHSPNKNETTTQHVEKDTPKSKSGGCMMKKLREKMKESIGNKSEDSQISDKDKITPTGIINECKSNNSSIISAIRKMRSQSVKSSSGASAREESSSEYERNTSDTDHRSDKKASDSEDSESDTNVYKNQKSIVRKFRCDCLNCRTWDDNDFDTKYEEFRVKKAKPVVRPPLLFRGEGEGVDIPPLLKSLKELNEFPTGRKVSSPNILVHGTVIPFPQKYVTNIPFIAPIHTSLRHLKYDKCLYMQQYGWPAIMRSMNLCMVNVANSGKTMTYVAAICSLLMEKDRYKDLPKENGPIALVLCAESKDVEKVFRRFLDVYVNSKTNVKLRVTQAVAPLSPSLMAHFKTALDVLITTPAVLVSLLSRNTFNLKRLCHLVVENIDEVFRWNKPLPTILGVVQDMLKHRVCARQVQFICTAEHWTFPVENVMKQLNSSPLIVIGNPIEAALYGRADINIKEVPMKAKQSVLYDIIKDHYRVYKTVIVCNKSEIKPLQEICQLYGVAILIADESMPGEDISDVHKLWSARSGGDYMVLICTDFVLRTQMDITDCSILVNYSLQASWPHFVKRWSCLIDNYKSPLNTDQDSFNCKIFVFIDEQSGKEIAKIINYFQTVGIKLPPNITQYYEKYKELTELQKITNKTDLCPTWIHSADCTSITCPHRHVLNPQLDTNPLNMSGTLTFDVVHIRDVNSFKIQPMQFETGSGQVHTFHNTKPEIDALLKEMKMKEFVINVKVDEMYVLEVESRLMRCVVKRIIDHDSVTKIPSKVVVEGVDSGCSRRVSTSDLFEVPDNLKKIPSSLMDLVIVNILPLNKEKSWYERARKLLAEVLEDNKSANVYYTGNVALNMGRTVWMENFQMHSPLSYLKQVVTCFTLLPYLTQQGFVKVDKLQLKKLYAECEKYGVPVPEYDMKTDLKVVVKQPTPQWAFLPDNLFNAVTFSSGYTPRKFFVKLQKFSDIYNKFNKSIQELIEQRSLQLKSEEITVGNCYLAPDPEIDHVYSRAIVTDIKEDTADCYYVDYGDVAYIPLKKIKFLPNDYITKLPFQSIECGLHGVSPVDSEWSADALDILYKYCFENNSNYYRTLYTLVMKEETGSHGGNTKYTIQLYDYTESTPKMINNVMIDCGLAVPKREEPFNLEAKLEEAITPTEISNREENYMEDADSNDEDENYVELEISEQGGEVSSFDFVCTKKRDFFTEVGIDMPKECKPSKPKTKLPEMRALPVSDMYTPNVDWHQVDNVIKMFIKVPVTEYEIKLVAGRVLSFSAEYSDRKYTLQLQLFDLVNKTFSHSPGAFAVNVVLTKLKQAEWPRLVLSTEPTRKIRYNVEKLEVSDDEEEKRLSDRLRPRGTIADDDDGKYYDEIGSESSDSDFSISLDSNED